MVGLVALESMKSLIWGRAKKYSKLNVPFEVGQTSSLGVSDPFEAPGIEGNSTGLSQGSVELYLKMVAGDWSIHEPVTSTGRDRSLVLEASPRRSIGTLRPSSDPATITTNPFSLNSMRWLN